MCMYFAFEKLHLDKRLKWPKRLLREVLETLGPITRVMVQ